MSQPPPPPPPPPAAGPTGQPSGKSVIALLAGVGVAIALVGVAAAVRASLPSSQPASHTVTYRVGGYPANVSYGPAGSDLSGSVGMNKTDQLGDAAYYAITAQLDGGGSVTCEIDVDGQVVSRGAATASYGIAQCEIVSDGSGGWRSATGS